jgi:hypothetical protein
MDESSLLNGKVVARVVETSAADSIQGIPVISIGVLVGPTSTKQSRPPKSLLLNMM